MRLILAAALIALPLDALADELGWALKPAVEALDLDGDGLLSPAEIGGTRVPEAFDINEDGLFSIVELSQGYWALFDADRSGYLEQEEKEAMRGLPAAGVYRYDDMM
jgi:hypothetical protein